MLARRSLFISPLLIVACRSPEPVRIGDAYPRDENTARFIAAVQSAIDSTQVRIALWTVGGFPLGSTIQLNTEQASLFANDPSVVAVVGHAGSRDALLGASVYNARGVPNVVPNATSRRLGDAGPWTFLLVPNDSIEGEFIADFAVDSLNAKRIGVFYLGDEYGIGLRDGVSAALRRRGMDVLDATLIPSDNCFTPRGADVLTPIIQAGLRRSRPDVVVVTAGSYVGWCIADVIHSTSPQAWILFSDGMDGARRVPAAVPHVVQERVRGVEFWAPGTDSLNVAFVEHVQRALNRAPDASEALVYDAYMLLVAAVREVGPDRAAIRNWLESLGRTRDPWPGVTGPIAFNRPRSEILRMGGPAGGQP